MQEYISSSDLSIYSSVMNSELVINDFFLNKYNVRYLDNNKFREAISALNFALEINPLHEHTHQLIADAYIKIAKFDLALSHHLKAKEINPSNYLNYYLLGSDYLWSGNKGDASSNFLKAIEFNPKYCQSYYGLSRVKKIAPYEPIFSDVSKFINDESIIKNDKSRDGYR